MLPPGLVAFGFKGRNLRERRLQLGARGVALVVQRRDQRELVGRLLFEAGGMLARLSQLFVQLVVGFTVLRGLRFELGDAGVHRLQLLQHALAIDAEAFPFRLLVGEAGLELVGPGAGGVELRGNGVVLRDPFRDGVLELADPRRRVGEVLLTFDQCRVAFGNRGLEAGDALRALGQRFLAVAQRVFAARDRRFELLHAGGGVLQVVLAVPERGVALGEGRFELPGPAGHAREVSFAIRQDGVAFVQRGVPFREG